MSRGLLLDTCAVVWMTRGDPIGRLATDALRLAHEEGRPVCVSPATAWELAMLVTRGRVAETRPPKLWYDEFRETAQVKEEKLTADLLMASCFLPQPLHRDPFDRILVATARELDLTIITRDRAILAYGAAGHVKTIAC